MKPPIADPFESPDDVEKALVFRLDFFKVFLFSLLVFSIILPPMILPTLSIHPPSFPSNVFNMILVIFLSAALVAGITLLVSVEVKTDRLRGSGFWGGRREIEWNEIQEVRFVWFFSPHAVISTSWKRNIIWLPLTLSDMKGFARAVEELAPEGNPLRQFLAQRRF